MNESVKKTKDVLDGLRGLEVIRRNRFAHRAIFFLGLFSLCCGGAIWFQQYDLIFLSTIFLGISATLAVIASDANEHSRELGERKWRTTIPDFSKRTASSPDADSSASPSTTKQPTPSGLGTSTSVDEHELARV